MTLKSLVTPFAPYFAWAPAWAFSLAVIVLALVAGWGLYEVLVRVVRRGLARRDAFWRTLIVRTRGPGRMALLLAALAAAVTAAPMPAGWADPFRRLFLIGEIVLAGWAALTALDIGAALYMRRYRIDVSDNLVARKHLTQVRILRRAAATLVILFTTALALMTISAVRQWGVSLLAAGGAAGILVGLALQPLLSNLMAGIQIAVTQPIRLDDAVIVENEWGHVEEITATYVVVRIWDERRMVLPLTYFIQKPFQNWTRSTAELMGAVMLYVDYTTPVEPLRAKLKELLEASPLWDGRVIALQVTDAKERTMEIRCLMSAADSGALFDLRCAVREALIAWLREEVPNALPRDRLELSPPLDGGTAGTRGERAGLGPH